jgi:hypothetical protein
MRAAVMLLGIVIIVTPLCGSIFGCGCTWPWSGLAEHCNFFDPMPERPCPFCFYSELSIPLLSGIALLALSCSEAGPFRRLQVRGSILLDSICGWIVFIVLTALAGSLF